MQRDLIRDKDERDPVESPGTIVIVERYYAPFLWYTKG